MISLNSKSIELLLKCIKKHKPELIWIIENDEEITVNQELGNELREAIGDELILNGYNNDDTPNRYGISLEKLIDEIGRFFI